MVWGKSIFAVTAALVFMLPLSANSGEYDDFGDSHPLRIIAYPVHAVGYTLEWLITRPIHTLVSQPGLTPVFGYLDNDFSIQDRSTGVLRTASTTPPPTLVPLATASDPHARRFAAESRTAADEAKLAAEIAEQLAERSARAFDRSLLK